LEENSESLSQSKLDKKFTAKEIDIWNKTPINSTITTKEQSYIKASQNTNIENHIISKRIQN